MPAKRILILTNRVPYPLNDGGNLATNAMVRGYAAQGWEVYLLSMNTSRHRVDKDVLAGLYKDIYRFETVEVNNNVSALGIVNNLLFSRLPNHAMRFMHRHFQDAMLKAINSFKPDVVQIESVFMSGYLPAIKKATNAVLTLRLHNIEWQVWQRVAAAAANPLKKWYLSNLSARIKGYEQQVWQGYDLLIPITDTDADVVRNCIAPKQMLTIPFGIDTKNTKPQDDERLAGYHIGAMDWLPNQDAIRWFATDVWPVVRQLNPDFQFYFAGRNMPDAFKELSGAGIHCMGEVTDAASFIADKKILIVPLRSGGGIRVKILEAMAAGKLVISTTVGMQGIDALAGKHYLLADTPQAFADAIQLALTNASMVSQIANEASLLVKELYNNDVLASRLSSTLQQILADR